MRTAPFDKEVLSDDGGHDGKLDHFASPLDTPVRQALTAGRTTLKHMDTLRGRLHALACERLLPPFTLPLWRRYQRIGGLETGHALRSSAPRPRVRACYRFQRGDQCPDPRGQCRHLRFQPGDGGVQVSDDSLLLRDRFMLGDHQPDQVIAAGVLQVDHLRSIPRPFIPEQIPATSNGVAMGHGSVLLQHCLPCTEINCRCSTTHLRSLHLLSEVSKA